MPPRGTLARTLALLATLGLGLLIGLLLGRYTPPEPPGSNAPPLTWSDSSAVEGVTAAEPVVLLHGLGGSARTWDRTVAAFEVLGFRWGGEVRSGRLDSATGPADLYAVSIDDPYASLDRWADELQAAIETVRRAARSRRVRLVTLSAGGLAARRYLVEHRSHHGVATLVTLATPHGGSALARLALVPNDGPDTQHPETAALQRALGRRLRQAVEMPAEAPILQQLVPENPWLDSLNNAPHPDDVRYVAVVFRHDETTDILGAWGREWQRIREEPTQSALAQRGGGLLADLLDEPAGGANDGAVLAERQRMSRIRTFSRHGIAVHEREAFSSAHAEAAAEADEILAALDEPPRLVRARDAGRTLQIDYEHPLPGLLTLHAVGHPGGAELPVGPVTVHRSPAGAFGRVQVGPLPDSVVQVNAYAQTPTGHAHGRAVLLTDSAAVAPIVVPAEASGLRVHVLAVRRVPPRKPNGHPWDPEGLVGLNAAPDLTVTLRVGWRTLAATRVVREAEPDTPIDDTLTANVDAGRETVWLEVWDADAPLAPDLMGQTRWAPGEAPLGRTTLTTDTGVQVEVEVARPVRHRPAADPEPLRATKRHPSEARP